MKKYHLIILASYTRWEVVVEADSFGTQTNSSTSAGFYSFYSNNELVACYPIHKTIIEKIEANDRNPL